MGDSIVRKRDSRLSKGEDVVLYLPGARIEHVTDSRADHGKRKWRIHTGTHRDVQRRQGRNNSNSGEVHEPAEEDEASNVWTDHLIRNFTSVWKQDPRIQEFEADGRQRYGEATLRGRGSGIRGFVGQLCGERRNVRERWPAYQWKVAAVFADGLSGAVVSGLGKVTYLN